MNLHQFGVRLRVQHSLAGAIALNLEDPDPCLCCFAFQVKGLAQLLQCGLRFVKILLSFFPRRFAKRLRPFAFRAQPC